MTLTFLFIFIKGRPSHDFYANAINSGNYMYVRLTHIKKKPEQLKFLRKNFCQKIWESRIVPLEDIHFEIKSEQP